MTTKTHAKTRTLVEGALLIALGTVLSYIPIFELPHGGSVTFVSTLPIILMSLRHGPKWGLFTAFVYSLIQLFLGLKNLTYCQTLGAQVVVRCWTMCCLTPYWALHGILQNRFPLQGRAVPPA